MQAGAQKAAASSTPFVEVKGHTPRRQFELEIRGRRLHIRTALTLSSYGPCSRFWRQTAYPTAIISPCIDRKARDGRRSAQDSPGGVVLRFGGWVAGRAATERQKARE